MKSARAMVRWLFALPLALLALVHRLYENYKFARRFTLHWSQALITFNVWMFWQHLDKLKDSHMAFLGGISALLGIAIGLYQWDAAREDKATETSGSR